MNFESCAKEYKNAINSQLESYINNVDDSNAKLLDSIRYSLMSSGKRIRGILLLAFSELFGQNYNDVLPFACAVEMIHTYSLIHDDLPCMDNDDIRRGKLSNHKVYGDSVALLAGDALLTLAFEILSTQDLFYKFGGKRIVDIYKILSSAAGIKGMISGQADDLCMEGGIHRMEKVLSMYKKKTGMLIEASVEIGAILSGAGGGQLNLAKKYGENIGVAFQLVDDLLDIVGEEKITGKPIGSDLSNRKCTYICTCGIENTQKEIEVLTEQSMKILNEIGGNNEFLKYLTKQLQIRVK